MGTIKKFEELEIWQISRKLSFEIFQHTQIEPLKSDFRFRDQIRAAARSVMDNIAEGFERSSRLEFINFLSIAKGSCGEIRSQLYAAIDQKYIVEDEAIGLQNSFEMLSSKIAAFISYLNKSDFKGQKFADRK